jgi:Protein of unknown function (DUF2946)
MKWFRSKIKHGSRLALFALATEFVLSFGHFHGIAVQAAPTFLSGPAQSEVSSVNGLAAIDAAARQQPPSNRDSDQQSNDYCAICAVIAMTNVALFATPPALLLPQAVEFPYLITYAGFVHLNSAYAAYRPRAPPLA